MVQKEQSAVMLGAQNVLTQVRKAVVGKDNVLLWVMAAILAKGHILLEDIPGVGKTTMALAFSKALDLSCNRMQFTPDVLPSDVTGYSVMHPGTNELEYKAGAVLCNLFLADELNRATSRSQSALFLCKHKKRKRLPAKKNRDYSRNWSVGHRASVTPPVTVVV